MLPRISVLMLAAMTLSAQIRPEQLRCEYRTNPLGIDERAPHLAWVLGGPGAGARGVRQSAYRVLAASSEAALAKNRGDLWDSGRVASDESAHVVYKGKPLASGARVYWKVRVWDGTGKASAWSAPAMWSMGLLEASDWKGKWIGRDDTGIYKSPHSPFRDLEEAHWLGGLNEFNATIPIPDRPIVRAVAVMAAESRFQFFINGKLAGRGSAPRLPEVLDVAPFLKPGPNTVSAKVTAPTGATPAIVASLRVEFASGEPLIIRTREAVPGSKDLGPAKDLGYAEERALPGRMLRKEFEAKPKLTRATAYVSGLGLYELYLNGEKAGDHVLAPNLTDYDKRVFYVTYDVTRQVRTGRNTIGLMLGNGRYWAPRAQVPVPMRSFGYPKALVQIELEYAGGGKSMVVSDETWKLTTEGPIRANNEFDGEEYDARAESPEDSKWEPAQGVAAPAGRLVAQMAEPLRVIETLKPVKLTELRPGVWIFDMGQNMVGWCRLRVEGPRGAAVRMRFAETLREDGSLYTANLRSARATDVYTLKGGGPETWEPRFTYHGFRFVEVTGFPGKPTPAALEGRVVHDDMTRIADFATSNELLNRIHRNILWGVRGNYRSIPTDCPQRDERQGWLGDRSMVSRGESYLHDVAAFYTKWVADLEDSQRPTGSIPDVSPNYWVMYNDDVTWPSTFLFVPGMLYEQYGDLRPIERHYPALRKWIEYMRGFLKDGLMPKDTYGDWCVPPESPSLIHSKDPARRTDGTLIGTAYYAHLLRLMARYARLIGRMEDAGEYETLAGTVSGAFQKRFYNSAERVYGNGTQTSSILPLMFHLAPEEHRQPVFASLVRKIERESKGHVGTGLIGAQWLMRTLSDNGRADLAYTIATQRDYPGWGYMISKDATTIWELWNGDTADPAMNSGNHVMQIGDLAVWMYEYLGGIRSDPERPGFKHVIVKPYPVAGLDWAKASHRSLYGTIATEWKRAGGRFHLNVTIPPNSTATVYLPSGAVRQIESGTYSFDE
ncbi:MAG: glycoside hydrolase family 78 protein [Bryobacteraceae bacterium]